MPPKHTILRKLLYNSPGDHPSNTIPLIAYAETPVSDGVIFNIYGKPQLLSNKLIIIITHLNAHVGWICETGGTSKVVSHENVCEDSNASGAGKVGRAGDAELARNFPFVLHL